MNLQFAIDFLPLVLRAEHRGFPGLSIPPQKLPEQEGLENLRPGLWWWSMEDLKRFLGLHNKLWDLCPCLCLRYTKCHTFAAGYLHLFGLWTFAPLHLRGFAWLLARPWCSPFWPGGGVQGLLYPWCAWCLSQWHSVQYGLMIHLFFFWGFLIPCFHMTQMLVSQFSIHHYQSQPFEMAGIRLHDFHAEAVLQRRERNISNSPDAVPLDVVFNSVWCRFVMMIPSQPVVRDLL